MSSITKFLTAFILSLQLALNHSLEQNYYYNWQHYQPSYSPNTVSIPQNTGLFSQNQAEVSSGPSRRKTTQLSKQSEGHGQAENMDNFSENGVKLEGHQGYGSSGVDMTMHEPITHGYGSYTGSEGTHNHGSSSYGHEVSQPHKSKMGELGPDGVLKILLTILPVIVCLIFVPSLIITVGVLLIPVIQWGDYFDELGQE